MTMCRQPRCRKALAGRAVDGRTNRTGAVRSRKASARRVGPLPATSPVAGSSLPLPSTTRQHPLRKPLCRAGRVAWWWCCAYSCVAQALTSERHVPRTAGKANLRRRDRVEKADVVERLRKAAVRSTGQWCEGASECVFVCVCVYVCACSSRQTQHCPNRPAIAAS